MRLYVAAALLAVIATSNVMHVDAAATASIGTFDAGHCARCEGLQYCTAMNGKLLFDPVIGYTREATTQLEKQGVCDDLDAKTFALSRFGDTFQFKDTPACRTLVYNFHCLSWVAATFARTFNGATASCGATTDGVTNTLLPLPPCRSLCVDVADKCVYSHFYRAYLENVCGNVPCVSREQELRTANTSAPERQRACVPAPWEAAPNTTVSRCSIREYVAPTASAHRVSPSTTLWLALLSVQTALYVYTESTT